MKEIQATRKIKQELTQHFKKGGTSDNLPEHLRRVNSDVVKSCYMRALLKAMAKGPVGFICE